MDAVWEELRYQRGAVQHFANELPALRQELAFFRADLEALEERLEYDIPAYPMRTDPFARTEVTVPPPLQHHRPQRRYRTRLGLCRDSDSSTEGTPKMRYETRFCTDSDSSEESVERTRNNFGSRDWSRDKEGGTAVPLEPNVWDCAMMLSLFGWKKGSELFGKFNVLMTIGLLFANITIQFLFVFAIKAMVNEKPFNTEAMVDMRLQEGQLYANMDRKAMTTMQQQTCALKVHNLLGHTIGSIKGYLKVHEHWVLHGNVICTLAIAIWVISIYSEVRRAIQDLIHSVLALPIDPQVRYEHRGGLLIVSAVPVQNKVSAVLVMLPRIFIAVMLCAYGMMFLANTVELHDLLTNAVALEFVKDIDEILFEAVMPRMLMGFVRIVKIRTFSMCFPQELAHHSVLAAAAKGPETNKHPGNSGRPPWCNTVVQTLFVLARLGVISAVIWTGCWSFLDPTVSYAREAYEDLCAANTNFTYMLHPITGVPVFANIDPYTNLSRANSTNAARCFYAAQYEMLRMRAGFPRQHDTTGTPNSTLISLVNGSNNLCWPRKSVDPFDTRSDVNCPEHDIGYFDYLAVLSNAEFYANKNLCRDQEVFFQVLRSTCLNRTFLEAYPKDLAFFQYVARCEDFRYPCNSTANNLSFTWLMLIHKICPEACGQCDFAGPPPPTDAVSADGDSERLR